MSFQLLSLFQRKYHVEMNKFSCSLSCNWVPILCFCQLILRRFIVVNIVDPGELISTMFVCMLKLAIHVADIVEKIVDPVKTAPLRAI